MRVGISNDLAYFWNILVEIYIYICSYLIGIIYRLYIIINIYILVDRLIILRNLSGWVHIEISSYLH